jgi:hypothetical protein
MEMAGSQVGFIFIASGAKFPNRSLFPHIWQVAQLPVSLFEQQSPDQVIKELWILLSAATMRFRSFWQVKGLAGELKEICKVIIRALERTDGETQRLYGAVATCAWGRLTF